MYKQKNYIKCQYRGWSWIKCRNILSPHCRTKLWKCGKI